MSECFFVSDLHGDASRYGKLLQQVRIDPPQALFIGGDLLPLGRADESYSSKIILAEFARLRVEMKETYPRVFLILGNDDLRSEEIVFLDGESKGLWEYVHNRRTSLGRHPVYGYSCVPPTPFLLKDWERYDVSRYVDPGCVAPGNGQHSVPIDPHELEYATISADLAALVGEDALSDAVFLFHTPPYRTRLDRAALDGMRVDHAPMDVHVGSIAVRRFIEQHQPLLTLHGHIHEAARLSGSWKEWIGRTVCLSAAHDGSELSLLQFDLAYPEGASRRLL